MSLKYDTMRCIISFPLCSSDYYYHKTDEPVFPKKLRNVPETGFKGRGTSEWASVRVNPEEKMMEHNLLAVRVMVTSDGSRYLGRPCISATSTTLPRKEAANLQCLDFLREHS